MTQINKQRPATPKQAAGRSWPPAGSLDKLLDPDLFKAMGDPTRLQLLACLAKCGRACSVTEVAQCCHVDLSVVSRHLAHLESAGVLIARKQGRIVFYEVRFADLSASLRALADAIDVCCPAIGGKDCATGRNDTKGACCARR